MPDAFDRASDLLDRVDQRTSEYLASRMSARSADACMPSAHECVECGDELPEGRREALPGVQHCVYCAEDLERITAAGRR